MIYICICTVTSFIIATKVLSLSLMLLVDPKETLVLRAGEGESYEVREKLSQLHHFNNYKIAEFKIFNHL